MRWLKQRPRSTITTWLGLMQQLIDESYDLLKDIHDTPITKLLKEGKD